MEALGDVVRAGKALYLGASSMPAYQFAKMQHAAERLGSPRFVSMQNHYNIIYREEEREMLPYCREEGIAVLPWSPLARGFVMGNRRKQDLGDTQRAKTDDYAQKLYYRDEDFAVVDKISAVAKRLGVSNAQVSLAWLLQQPGVTAPIIGASKLDHLEELVKALSLKLGEEEMRELNGTLPASPGAGVYLESGCQAVAAKRRAPTLLLACAARTSCGRLSSSEGTPCSAAPNSHRSIAGVYL